MNLQKRYENYEMKQKSARGFARRLEAGGKMKAVKVAMENPGNEIKKLEELKDIEMANNNREMAEDMIDGFTGVIEEADLLINEFKQGVE